MNFKDCEKAVKAMVEVKKSVDEETFNKMFKIFNDKYPDVEIMKVINDVYANKNIYAIVIYDDNIDVDSDMVIVFDVNKVVIKAVKPIITKLINFVVNLYTLNPNYPMFKCWKNKNNDYKDFQLPQTKDLFDNNFFDTVDFIKSLYYTCSSESIKTIEFMKNKFYLFN